MTKSRRTPRYIGAANNIPVTAASVVNGTANKSIVVNIPGAKIADIVDVSLALPTDNIVADGYVSAPSAVTLRFHSTAGTVSLAATTATVQVYRLF